MSTSFLASVKKEFTIFFWIHIIYKLNFQMYIDRLPDEYIPVECWQFILYIDRLHCILTNYAVYWLYCVLTDSVSILGSCRVDRRGVLERHFEDIKENSQKQTTQLHPRIQKRQFTSNPRSGQVNLLCSLINH